MPNFDRTGRGLGFADQPPAKPLPRNKGALAKALMKKNPGLKDQSIFPLPIRRKKIIQIPKVSLGK